MASLSTCAIVPPELLRRIAQNGTRPQREAALATLAADQSLRFARATAQLLAAGARRITLAGPAFAPHRTIYDAGHRETLPGKAVRAEGQRAGRDVEVNEAYDGLGATFDFFAQVYDRNSIDDAGMSLDASVHYGVRYDNAFWNGRQMVFGDGDGDIFNRFTASVDVIGHELTHGITADEANLVYLGQAGALNESISDVFGSLVKQYKRGETAAEADWLIGEGVFTRRVKGVALRSMKAPGTAFDDPVLGKDDQPATMAGYVHTTADNGGVHTNSGIPNHAFYLAAIALGGHAWDVAGRIWYETLRDRRLKANATFRQFAALTAANAVQGFGTAEQRAVAAAWQGVGIDASPSSRRAPAPRAPAPRTSAPRTSAPRTTRSR
ncbi:MAG TPA: M4 family metallopeptidase [Casimicrobiaceae bacterium]